MTEATIINYYNVLQVGKEASQKEIKKAYFELSIL